MGVFRKDNCLFILVCNICKVMIHDDKDHHHHHHHHEKVYTRKSSAYKPDKKPGKEKQVPSQLLRHSKSVSIDWFFRACFSKNMFTFEWNFCNLILELLNLYKDIYIKSVSQKKTVTFSGV